MSRRRTWVVWVVVLFVITNAATFVLARRNFGVAHPRFGKFFRVLDLVETRFVDEIDDDAVIEAAISGLVRATEDPYSAYLDPKDWNELMIRASGNFTGIGVHIIAKDRYISVVAPIKGTPAEQAGLRAGDLILKVDDTDLLDMSADQVVDFIRGPEGSSVRLTLMRSGITAPFEVEVRRAQIDVPAADWEMLADDVGYIHLREFNNQATDQTREALIELGEAGAKAMILDLRSNPGGLVDEAVGVADLFVGKGPVVHVVDRTGHKETMSATGQALDMPLVVLIDGGSASASEIVAGAVQDTGAGTLVGTTSFGKGSVQHLMSFEDGSGLRLTTQKYYTPSGRSIHGVGIEPDVVVSLEGIVVWEPFSLKEPLRRGDLGLDVLAVQNRLEFIGYTPETEGAFGWATDYAVRLLQASAGLPQTGVVDQDTSDALNRAVSEKLDSVDPQLDRALEILAEKIAK